jgi:hypothetical protein
MRCTLFVISAVLVTGCAVQIGPPAESGTESGDETTGETGRDEALTPDWELNYGFRSEAHWIQALDFLAAGDLIIATGEANEGFVASKLHRVSAATPAKTTRRRSSARRRSASPSPSPSAACAFESARTKSTSS